MKPTAEGVAGQSSWYVASEATSGYTVAVTIGSGDCLAGCINQHTWNYSVSATGKISLDSEQGDDIEVTVDPGTSDPANVTVRLVAGPVCPVEKDPPDPSCAPRPVPGAEIVLRDPSGAEVARASADSSGVASFSVPAGAYYVESAAAVGMMRQSQDIAFSVPGGRSVTVTMSYDTGIR
jgi:hypothetical protein